MLYSATTSPCGTLIRYFWLEPLLIRLYMHWCTVTTSCPRFRRDSVSFGGLKLWWPKCRLWAWKLLFCGYFLNPTVFQFQFMIGIVIIEYFHWTDPKCQLPKGLKYFVSLYLIIFIYLFVDFYRTAYAKDKKIKKQQ